MGAYRIHDTDAALIRAALAYASEHFDEARAERARLIAPTFDARPLHGSSAIADLIATNPRLAADGLGRPYACDACGRTEIECSIEPCPEVQAERAELTA